MKRLLLLLLLLPTLATALPWWVQDEDDAEQLSAMLDALWPGHPIEVLLGEPDFAQPGISFDGARLTLVHEDRVRFSPSDGDMATQVALVRSWLRESAVQDRGWVPPAERPRRPGPFVEVLLGGGLRLPTTTVASDGAFVLGPASPNGHLTLGGGFATRHLRLGARGTWTFAERAGLGSQAFNLQRLFVGGTVSLSGELGQVELQTVAGGGARIAVLRALLPDSKAVVQALPSLFVGVQVWGPLSERLDFGGGLGAGFDTASIAVRVGEDAIPLLLSPVTVYGELGVRFGCPCPPARKFEGP